MDVLKDCWGFDCCLFLFFFLPMAGTLPFSTLEEIWIYVRLYLSFNLNTTYYPKTLSEIYGLACFSELTTACNTRRMYRRQNIIVGIDIPQLLSVLMMEEQHCMLPHPIVVLLVRV